MATTKISKPPTNVPRFTNLPIRSNISRWADRFRDFQALLQINPHANAPALVQYYDSDIYALPNCTLTREQCLTRNICAHGQWNETKKMPGHLSIRVLVDCTRGIDMLFFADTS